MRRVRPDSDGGKEKKWNPQAASGIALSSGEGAGMNRKEGRINTYTLMFSAPKAGQLNRLGQVGKSGWGKGL